MTVLVDAGRHHVGFKSSICLSHRSISKSGVLASSLVVSRGEWYGLYGRRWMVPCSKASCGEVVIIPESFERDAFTVDGGSTGGMKVFNLFDRPMSGL
jgi:hypothetical protein